VPLSRIFSVSNTKFLERIIADIDRERVLNAPHRAEMEACRVTELLLLTSRYYQTAQRMAASPVEYAHYEQLCLVRQRFQKEFTDHWTVESMAKLACLSPNRFAVLYKKFFEVSPIDDLIEIRLAEGKWLLTQGTSTVAEVADRCGFRSLSYFSRLFKARTGQTPKRFRV
jgi:AraC-like DNA-binding protein